MLAPATNSTALAELTALLRESDAMIARAVCLLDEHVSSGALARESGLPVEMYLMLVARRTGSDARTLTNVAATLRQMPHTRALFADGTLSWGQVRAITAAVRHADAAGRARIDALVAQHAGGDDDPDALLDRVADLVADLRADLALAREDRQIAASFLAVQPRFDGGATLYGEADPASAATILDALDHAAAAPASSDEPESPTRAQQRFDALLTICEGHLAGDAPRARPRPRLLATIDLDRDASGARVLWSLPGRPPRLTPIAAAELQCDATIVPVLLRDHQPIAVGAADAIPQRIRDAVTTRDGGCRFPTCGAPAAWSDIHHITPRALGGDHDPRNLLLLCRRCHRRVHRHRWRIDHQPDGTISFTHRGRRYSSTPRARPPSPG